MQAAQQGIKALFLGALVVALVACGGGGGSGSPPPPTPSDSTPDAFSFAPAADVAREELISSDTVAISGIDTAAPISITGGEYAINGGAFTSTEGTIQPGQSVAVRTTASPDYSTSVDAVLTIGGVSATFTVTTLADLVPATASYSSDLGIREDIVITFDEPVVPGSLQLEGLLADLAGNPTWNSENTELRLSPIEGAWESGVQNLAGYIDDAAGNNTSFVLDFEIPLVFEDFQAAAVVIGQSDFESSAGNQGGSGPEANTMDQPYGTVTFSNGRMWIPDYSNNRILGFDGVPEANNSNATWVVGQQDFSSRMNGTSASEFWGPQMAVEHEGRFYMLEYRNDRITIFDDVPLSPPAVASNVIGQPDLTSKGGVCSETGLDYPEIMQIVNGKLIVVEAGNHRVLVWNEVPAATDGEAADLVVGQAAMTTCHANDDDQDGASDSTASARTLNQPSGIWSDGEKLVVVDGGNNRVLIWNTFPSTNFQAADIVVGQSDFTNVAANDDDQDGASDFPSARTLDNPYEGVWSNGLQLFVADSDNARILVWNNFPTESFQPADVVLGQSDFSHGTANDDNQDNITDSSSSARTLDFPVGGGLYRDKMVVLDANDNRALVFEAK